jgi:hypothetical protein
MFIDVDGRYKFQVYMFRYADRRCRYYIGVYMFRDVD